METILEHARTLIRQVLSDGDTAIDATAGTGQDTAFLARLVGPDGRVYALDIQEDALFFTRQRLEKEQLDGRVQLVQAGHQTLHQMLPPEKRGRVAAAMFNLGYLPGGRKTIVTRPETTLEALDHVLEWLRPGGIVTVVAYRGHPGGMEESRAVIDWASRLDFLNRHVLRYEFLNTKEPSPFLIAVQITLPNDLHRR